MRTFTRILVPGIILATSLLLTYCQHEDEEIIPVKGPDPIVRGTETLSCTNCTPLISNGASADFNTSGVPTGQWYFDKSHSNVMWETSYKGIGALLIGRFTYFVVTDLSFDEANPANCSFKGYVRLNSVNTGEPNRDGGCLLTSYGTTTAKTSEPENIATLESTSIEYSTTDEGYVVKANLTFMGVTKEVLGKLYYIKQSPDGTNFLCGITAEFSFLAKTDFAVSSTNIDDKVTIKINATIRKKG